MLLCNHPHLFIPRLLHPAEPKLNLHSTAAAVALLFLAAIIPLSSDHGSENLVHTVCTLLWLTLDWAVLSAHPCCSLYPNFLPFKANNSLVCAHCTLLPVRLAVGLGAVSTLSPLVTNAVMNTGVQINLQDSAFRNLGIYPQNWSC